MYIALCDDNLQELQHLEHMLLDYAREHSLQLRLRAFTDAEDMLNAAQEERFTHYFLDILMPCMDGIAAAQEIRSFDEEARLVFLTASNEYSYQSYRVQATDYLLKPMDPVQLAELMNRLGADSPRLRAGLCIQNGRSLFRISFARLSYLEVYQKKLYFHMTDGQVRCIPGTLAEYEAELLARPEFVKIHRSYIVNLHQVSALTPEGCVMFSGKSLPISRLLYNQVRGEYMQHLFGGIGV